MVTPRTLEIAEAILQYTQKNGSGLFVVHSRVSAMSSLTNKPHVSEVHAAARWLVQEGLLHDGGDNSSFTITAPGLKLAGSLAEHIRKSEEREETAHRSNQANINGVRNATITAWISALVSLGTLAYTIWQANQ